MRGVVDKSPRFCVYKKSYPQKNKISFFGFYFFCDIVDGSG